ncbi:hypothetical protein [Streptomyces sp. AS58]|uniref:hypothetical protein n=1 Tax=Streptomyces sp. AS58 TaxID=1519489 RepID=UPI0006B01A43|nr:hypothetical protein [Streptomyces sp. AS58]
MALDPDLNAFETLSFSYMSRPASFSPLRRIPSFDDVADNLRGFLEVDARDFDDLVLVSHSQGGLVVQRYLARMLSEGRGAELARIRRVVLFACPNLGSELALTLRRAVWWGRHPQEHQLRPITAAVTEAQRAVVTRIDHAKAVAPDTCPIAITAYAGDADNIVKPASARSVFRDVGVLPGDHFTIVRPDSPEHRSYTALKRLLLTDPDTWNQQAACSEPVDSSVVGGPRPALGAPVDDPLSTSTSTGRVGKQSTGAALDPALGGARRVAEWNARMLGVKPAIEAQGARGDLPLYIPRDHDRELRRVVREMATTGGLIVLLGEPSTGKSRSAYEAVVAELPDWWLLRPQDVTELEELVDLGAGRAVVWLDDLGHFLDARPTLSAAILLRLLDPRAPTVVVGALWPESYDRYAGAAEASGAAPGRASAEAREVLQLARTVDVVGELSESEQAAAEAAADTDPRIAAALAGSDFGLFQTLAGAPALVRRWRSGDVYGRALMNAAIDAVRLGGPEILTVDYLRAAAPGYLTSAQWARATPQWLDTALDYCATMVNGATAALSPAAGHQPGSVVGYTIADYLLRTGERHRRFTLVPAEAWHALLDTVVDTRILAEIGWSAEWRLLYELAHEFYRAAGSDGVVRRARLLKRQGLAAEARQLLEPQAVEGQAQAIDTLVGWARSDLSDPEQLTAELARYAPVHQGAAAELARALGNAGRSEESSAQWLALAEQGYPPAARAAARHLLNIDRRAEAMELLRAHAATQDSRRLLVNLLLEEGTQAGTAEAEVWLRRWLAEGMALGQLATLLLDQGRTSELEQMANEDIGQARDRMVDLWVAQNLREPDIAEYAVDRCRQWSQDEHGPWRIINLLKRLGRTNEAIDAGVAFEREHGGNDDLNAVITSMLMEQDRVDEVLVRADAGDSRAQQVVAEGLLDQGRVPELEQRAAHGEWHACRILSDWLEEQGRVPEAVALWRRWVDLAPGNVRYPLTEILEKHGLDDELLELLEAEPEPLGKYNGRRLADLLAKKGRIAELRDRAAAGDVYADTELIAHLLRHGKYEEACRRAVAGSGAATRLLFSWPEGGQQVMPGLERYGLRLDGTVAVPAVPGD